VNLSRSGAKLADLVHHQLPRLAELSPDVVTVDIGGNGVISHNAERFSQLACELTAGLPVGAFVPDVPYVMQGDWERRASETGLLLARCVEDNEMCVVRLHDAEQAHRGGQRCSPTSLRMGSPPTTSGPALATVVRARVSVRV
jgi:acyl-CoA thioesterase-1